MRLPGWIYITLGLTALPVAAGLFTLEVEERQALAAAARSAPPAVVDVDRVDTSALGPADEVAARGRVLRRHDGEIAPLPFIEPYHFYVVAGLEDGLDTDVAQAVVLVSDAQDMRWRASLDDTAAVEIRGRAGIPFGFDAAVAEALAERGLAPAPGFFVIRPFVESRDAALAPPEHPAALGPGILLALAVVTMIRGVIAIRRRRDRDEAIAYALALDDLRRRQQAMQAEPQGQILEA